MNIAISTVLASIAADVAPLGPLDLIDDDFIIIAIIAAAVAVGACIAIFRRRR